MATVESALPPVFAGRPNSAVRTVAASRVLRMRGFWKRLFWSVVSPISTVGWLIFFWPLGLASLVWMGYEWKRLINIISESGSGRVQTGQCPTCQRAITFWVRTGFACPFCRRTLMMHGSRLYDIT